MSAQNTPLQDWLQTASAEELLNGAIWLQEDARSLYAAADKYRILPCKEWIAVKVQKAAAHSAAAARAATSNATRSAV